ncbi:Z-ring formation inhibitor MciZ [Halalkalibacter kiskunsagensis]|uniref:Z-ring formation inhibitor MciZ n=1 Tax=Halalkalibacter kiskunsagensis TaxID=1548599 RepID=A0ABV6KJ70_9BACI
MKIYIHQQGVIMAGKAWEIQAKLKQMRASFHTLEEWVDTVYSNGSQSNPNLTASATAQKNKGSASYLRPIV